MRSPLFAVGALSTCLALAQGGSPASQIAFDYAGDSMYSGYGSTPLPYMLNGGYGWGGGWQGAGPHGAAALFLESSSINGSGDPQGTGDINSPRTPGGRAWGMRPVTQGGYTPNAIARPFNGALAPGQTFAIDFDVGATPTSLSGTYGVGLGGYGGIGVEALSNFQGDYEVGNLRGFYLDNLYTPASRLVIMGRTSRSPF
jgi:hypothetical protein